MVISKPQYVRLRGLVFQSLDNAVENGYEGVFTDPTATVAVETLDHDAEVEGLAEEISPQDHPSLVPKVSEIVVEWRDERRFSLPWDLT